MSLSRSVVSRPTTVLIVFVVLTALGVYASLDLPLDLLPDMELPYVAVSVNYPGAGPEEVERRVTRLVESALSSVSGMEYLGSSSSSGSSLVYVQLAFGSNMGEAMNDIRAKLDFIKNALPDEASTPMVFKMDPNMIPIMNYAVSGKRSAEELRDYAEDLTERLEQIDGVASANVSGGREKAVIVEIPRDRLQAYSLTVTQVAQLVGAQNVQVAGGTITAEDYDYAISTVGEYKSLEDVRNTVISYKPMAPASRTAVPAVATVKLRDIADVYEGFKDQSSSYFLNGVPCVEVSIQKQSGRNAVQTARAVKERMKEIVAEAPSDISITETRNTTDIIQRSVDQVSSTAVQGGILAVIVLFVFLRSVRSTAIIGLTIPISLIVTLGIMFFSGMTLNVMTLAGLALGVGMLVDNSIVVLENIFTYREKGAKPVQAAILGSQEMILAITASTLTTICVFLPLIMYKKELGIIGEVFKGLSFTVVISLLCSLGVAVVLVPVLAGKYFKISGKADRKTTGPIGRLDRLLADFFDRLDRAYGAAVRKVIKHKAATVLVIAGLFVASVVGASFMEFVFMPTQAADSVVVNVSMPVGTRLEVTEAVLRDIERIVYDEVDGHGNVTVLAGTSGFGGLGGTSSYTGRVTVSLPPLAERTSSEEEIKDTLRAHFDDFPGASISFGSGQTGMSLGGGGSAVSVKVKSDDMDKARDTANAIRELLEAKAADFVTEPQVSLKDGLPRVNVVIDRERLYGLGLNVYSVGQEIRANIAGTTASRFRQGGTETDILVMLAEDDKTRLTDLEQIFVTNAQGARVPVSSFAHYEEGVSPITITRENQSRVVTVNAGAKPGVSIADIQKKVESLVKSEIPRDPAVRVEYAGDYQDLVKAVKQFVVIIVMAIILVFAVMASQFESLLDPFIVLFTLPLSVVGVVVIFAVTGQPLSVLVAVGVLILVGIIVNNGIVLVDYTNLLRKRGVPLAEACAQAAESRLRPILMTTLTTVLGLLPMAFLPGEGSEMTMPIGKTVLGGLGFGTLMTLFLMPVMYYIFNRIREKRDATRAARREAKVTAALASAGGVGTVDTAEGMK